MTREEIVAKIEELDTRIKQTLNSPYTRGARVVNEKCQKLKRKYQNKLDKLNRK